MACPICFSSNIKQIYSGIDKAISKFSNNYSCQLFLFGCCDCGMIFLDGINYDLREIHESYWKMLTNNIKNGYSVDSTEDQDLLLNGLNKYRKIGNLLEVGCGEGKFLQLAQDKGWKVTGVELSRKAATIALQRYGLNVLNGSLEQAYQELKKFSFDIIVMWGVIEHLQDPVGALRIARLLLRKRGLLIIYTPNANSIFHKLARVIYLFTYGLIKFPMERVIIPIHIMYFKPDTLRKAIIKCNFSIKKIEMRDINLDFIFKAHNNFWWSNKISLNCAKFLQRLSHLDSMHSHMVVFAESI